jgi:hypothetical protein
VNVLHYRRPAASTVAATLVLTGLSLGAATVAIAALRAIAHVTYPAPVYLLAVIAVGARHGTVPAAITSVAAFLLYDFLFVQPLYTLTINSPDEWLNLLLLLAVSVFIGRMAAALAARAAEAADRAREAENMHAITGILAATRTVSEAAPAVVSRIRTVTSMDRVWFGLGAAAADERVLADTASPEPLPLLGWQVVLQRTRDGEMRWVRAHVPGAPLRTPRVALHRVRVEVAGETLFTVGSQGEGQPGTRPGGDANPVGGGRPAGPGRHTRPSGPRGNGRGDRPRKRGPQDIATRLRVARPADSAGHHSSGGREHARSPGSLVRG